MRTAVIGIGVVGSIHTSLLLDKGYEVVAICDTDIEKCQQYPQIKAYTDYREMLEKEDLDVVHICTPHDLHAEMVVAALNRDIHVLCEKPLCSRKEDLPAILEAEKASKAQLGVCFQNRYIPCNKYVKEYLQDKTIVSIQANVHWGRDKAYYAAGEWRGIKARSGGGVLINQAIHTIDLLQWLGGDVEYLTASVSNLTLRDVIDVEDTAFLILQGKTNCILSATNGCPPGFPVDVQIQTQAEIIRLIDNEILLNGRIVHFPNSNQYLGKPCYGMGHSPLIDDFYDCIESGRKFSIDGSEGAKALRLVFAAYESNGEKVAVGSNKY